MSDILGGWAELISRPLGPEPVDDTPLAALPCLFGAVDSPGPLEPRPSVGTEH